MVRSYECVIVANGLFPSKKQVLLLVQQAQFVIACDGAVVHLEKYRIPDVIVGDLDSIPEELCSRYSGRIYQVEEQETNDLTKAVVYAKAQGFQEVLILGATGLREDHTLGNISLLAQYAPEFECIEILSDFGKFISISSTTTFECEPGQQVSLFSLYPHGIVSVTGLLYPINNRRLLYWWEATLNETVGKEFTVILNEEANILVYQAFSDLHP